MGRLFVSSDGHLFLTDRNNIEIKMPKTDVLLLDEPTNHLDVFQQHKILQTVRKKNLSAVVVLHDLNLAAR